MIGSISRSQNRNKTKQNPQYSTQETDFASACLTSSLNKLAYDTVSDWGWSCGARRNYINFNFFSFCDLKLKFCQLSLQKMWLNLHFQEVKSFSNRDEKNPTRYKRAFFLIIFINKNINVLRHTFLIVFERCSKSKQKK